MIWLLLGLLLFGLILLGCYFPVRNAFRPVPPPDWSDPACAQNPEQYSSIQSASQWLNRQKTEEITIRSTDGYSLCATFCPTENPVGTAILFHGYHTGFLRDFPTVMPMYQQMGFQLLLVDQRCHGRSQGALTTLGHWESEDVLSWLEEHNHRWPQLPVVLAGLSMGATTVLLACGMELPGNVRAAVADCGFTSPWDIFVHVLKHYNHLPPFPFGYLAAIWLRVLGNYHPRERSTTKAMEQCSIPVLFIHGKKDRYVPPEMSLAAYRCHPGEKELLLVDGASHGLSALTDPEGYRRKLAGFLRRYFETRERDAL